MQQKLAAAEQKIQKEPDEKTKKGSKGSKEKPQKGKKGKKGKKNAPDTDENELAKKKEAIREAKRLEKEVWISFSLHIQIGEDVSTMNVNT